MGTVRGQDLAHMFFPAAVRPGACGDAQQAPPALLMLAGDSSTAKTALLLQYAYNAALRGEQSQPAPPLLTEARPSKMGGVHAPHRDAALAAQFQRSHGPLPRTTTRCVRAADASSAQVAAPSSFLASARCPTFRTQVRVFAWPRIPCLPSLAFGSRAGPISLASTVTRKRCSPAKHRLQVRHMCAGHPVSFLAIARARQRGFLARRHGLALLHACSAARLPALARPLSTLSLSLSLSRSRARALSLQLTLPCLRGPSPRPTIWTTGKR
jgi:hypothetical protein